MLAALTIPWLCGFGIYLGRVLRWNSWDLIRNPETLLLDIWDIVIHPSNNTEAWMITLAYGGFLWFAMVISRRIGVHLNRIP